MNLSHEARHVLDRMIQAALMGNPMVIPSDTSRRAVNELAYLSGSIRTACDEYAARVMQGNSLRPDGVVDQILLHEHVGMPMRPPFGAILTDGRPDELTPAFEALNDNHEW